LTFIELTKYKCALIVFGKLFLVAMCLLRDFHKTFFNILTVVALSLTLHPTLVIFSGLFNDLSACRAGLLL